MKQYREGPIGALMDEYERALEEIKPILNKISQEQFLQIIDTETEDQACRSFQTIMKHVTNAGYAYCDYIREQFGDSVDSIRKTIENLSDTPSYLDAMFEYTLQTMEGKWDITFDEIKENIMKVRWGQEYDFEQLLEHAIVHVLRHRRQLEKFLLKL
ncbi:MAG: DinB family protein [Candidatus Kariarchaeaceae archaeon]|jgi:uncharacterized damage-inducible protein DinB